MRRLFLILAGVTAATAAAATQNPPPAAQPQKDQINLTISSRDPGSPPHYAVPDFIALSNDVDTQAAAKTLGQVLWDDLAFEREFDMIPRDTYTSVPPSKSIDDVQYDRWRELGADGVVIGTVQKDGAGLKIQIRLYSVNAKQSALTREYTGSATNPRAYAHTIADEIHKLQRGLEGVARTKLAFSSDRDRERITGTVENREVKEIYIADYDGANQRRITINRALNIMPTWSPDGRALAYTSYARGFPTIFISLIYEGRRLEPFTPGTQNWLPSWSPDGTKIVFTSSRDGNSELYIMNRDGSGVRRLTNNPAIDTTPSWSPTGSQIAFTSDRSGGPAVYVMGADGLNLHKISADSYCDRATWAPNPFNELAFVCRTGGGYDIKAYEFATGRIRQITTSEGSNESPSYSPSGRHIAFTSTRTGKVQIFTIGRDGNGLRQVTRVGNNFTPDWSR